MARGKQTCDCGCGGEDYFNRLVEIQIEGAIDESLRRTFVAKRFLVLPQCYDPFMQELQAMKLLNDAVRRYTRASFYVRLVKMRQVVRLQWLINERNKGDKRARRLSIRSGLLFAAGPRVAGWLELFYRWKDQRRSLPMPTNLSASPTPSSEPKCNGSTVADSSRSSTT